MPEPFSLTKAPPGQYSVQVLIARKSNSKHDILKDVNLLGVPARTDSCLQGWPLDRAVNAGEAGGLPAALPHRGSQGWQGHFQEDGRVGVQGGM
eukprot:8534219-Pyramimonas_sp.AAC.1